MKNILLGALALISLNLNAQNMESPKETVIKMFVATDERNWQEVEALFADRVIVDYSSMNGQPASTLTPDEITSGWKTVLPGFESTHHQLGNLLADVKNDNAEVFAYGTAHHYLPDEAGNVWLVVGTYDFELLKDEQDKWKISSMRFNFKYQEGNTTLPEKAMKNIKP